MELKRRIDKLKEKRKNFMTEMMQKAHELGQLIKDSDEMKALKAAEEAQAKDEAAQELIKEFNMKRMNLARDMQEGKIEQGEAIKKNNDAFNEMVEKSELIKNYVAAKKAFDKTVNEVNGIINIYIMGEEEGGCTHDCHTCGGCH